MNAKLKEIANLGSQELNNKIEPTNQDKDNNKEDDEVVSRGVAGGEVCEVCRRYARHWAAGRNSAAPTNLTNLMSTDGFQNRDTILKPSDALLSEC